MSTPPLTHHEILALVEPFTRAGRRVDLGASDRLARRLAFRPVDRAAPWPECAPLREELQLEQAKPGRWRLTRRLTLEGGLQAVLHAEGPQPGELLARIEAVAPARQFARGAGHLVAFTHRADAVPGARDAGHPAAGAHRVDAVPVACDTGHPAAGVHRVDAVAGAAAPEDVRLVLTQAEARLPGLELALKVPGVGGIAAELDLAGAGTLDLPDDLLSVLGWDWSLLHRVSAGWRGRVHLRKQEPARSRDAEAKFEQVARHLAATLAEPPARFHERWVGARWKVVFRRTLPLLGAGALIAGAAGVQRLHLAADSLVWMLIFHAPPLLLVAMFCMQEIPRVEFPPLPRRSRRAAWGAPPAPGPGAHVGSSAAPDLEAG